jgi:fermentation-respiration switch protein FrsA (DUF1100 family)
MVDVRELSFDSQGTQCAADLYLPDNAACSLPCVVMAHGGSGTKRLGLPKYARRFAARGMAVLVFDYRHFGASGGEPRQLIDVAQQRADYHAAISRARSLPGIDPNRIALWGTSLSGGHVLAVAAHDASVAAVVSQVPMIDGWHRGRKLKQRLDRDIVRRTLQFFGAALRDVARGRAGLPPFLVPVVAAPGALAVFTEPEAKAAFDALGGEATGWRNELAPRFFFALPRYEKGSAERIAAPLLMCLADNDLQASSDFAAQVAARARNVEIRHFPLGHFDVYLGAPFETLSSLQADFLCEKLRVEAPAEHARVASNFA